MTKLMKILSSPRLIAAFAILAGIALTGCGNDPDEVVIPAPKITSFTPLEAASGETVTITGENFSTVLSENAVMFNTLEAVVTSATATQLEVTVPKGRASSGYITVTVNGKPASSSAQFTYIAPPNTHTVYVAGYRSSNGGNQIAGYWTGGTSNFTALSSSGKNSVATGIVVNGTDIHVSGNDINANNKSVAKYWKNGEETILFDSLDKANGYTFGIAVSGTDVYVAGYTGNSTMSSNALRYRACYWKNGQIQYLQRLTTGLCYAYCIAVVGNDVYVGGTHVVSSARTAVLWKNGVMQQIGKGGPAESWCYGICVTASGDVYLSGSETEPSVGGVACYWKVSGGTVTENILENGSHQGFASSIFVENNNVHIIGYSQKEDETWPAVYWLNNTPTELSTAAVKFTKETGLTVVDGQAYYCSSIDSPSSARYWISGEPVSLAEENTTTRARAIFVTSKEND